MDNEPKPDTPDAPTVTRAAPTSPRTSPGHQAPQPGATLKHYEIIRELGRGGMGAVHLARDTKLGRLIALKILLDPHAESAQRFLTEARATAQCKHENIVVIYDVDEADGVPFMALEHL